MGVPAGHPRRRRLLAIAACAGSAVRAAGTPNPALPLRELPVGRVAALDASASATPAAQAGGSEAADDAAAQDDVHAEGCGQLPGHVEMKNVLDIGSAPQEGDATSDGSPFGVGTIVEVRCAPGFESETETWELNCTAPKSWDVRKGGALNCQPVLCEVPYDPAGTWQGRRSYNESLHLVCADGYVAAGGTPVLSCPHEEDPLEPARCVPSKGSAQAWREALRYQALLSLLGVVTVLLVVVASCWRNPVRMVHRAGHDLDRPFAPGGTAERDLE